MVTTEFVIEPSHRDALMEAGLDRFDALMRDAEGEIICVLPRTDVLRLRLDGAGAPVECFLKRTRIERLRRVPKMVLRGARPHVEAYREVQAITALRRAGFSTAEVMAWGEQRRLGVPLRGFMLARRVDGRDAQLLFRDGDPSRRRRLLRSWGGLMARLHLAGFFQVVRLKDLFCTGEIDDTDGDLPLTLIDRSGQWAWPKRFMRLYCRGSLERMARRHGANVFPLTPDEIDVLTTAYADGIAPRWSVPAATVAGFLTAMMDPGVPREDRQRDGTGASAGDRS